MTAEFEKVWHELLSHVDEGTAKALRPRRPQGTEAQEAFVANWKRLTANPALRLFLYGPQQ